MKHEELKKVMDALIVKSKKKSHEVDALRKKYIATICNGEDVEDAMARHEFASGQLDVLIEVINELSKIVNGDGNE